MPPQDDQEDYLSEQQLREIYDNEEIERFVCLFSAYVTEVHLDDSPAVLRPPPSSQPRSTEVHLDDSPAILRPPPSSQPQSISEGIAQHYIVPILPTAAPPLPLFTLGRLRIAIQRCHIAIQLAVCCSIFWMLWYYNLLLPSLFLRILYSLFRRKLLPYPTLAELRAHREEVDRADEFGREMSTRFSPSSPFGLTELWRLFKVFNKGKVTKEDSSTVLDSAEPQNSQESDFKRAILQALSEVADLHERVKNIFIWRHPAASRIYGLVLLLLFMLTLLLPAKYLAKLIYFVGGVSFWHITPVIAALSPNDRARLPPAFADVPTEAEYAMERVSQRVAAGLDAIPKKRRAQENVTDDAAISQSKPTDREVNWKKWAGRAATGMAWAEDGGRLLAGKVCNLPPPTSCPLNFPSRPRKTILAANISLLAFPAQHTSSPGLVTLTTATLFFTPLGATSRKLTIPLANIRGLRKKNGILNSLIISWVDGDENAKEEKFPWVGGRDELFTRLVGTAEASKKRVIK
ncbi:hypothetical protein FB45DRAFT_747715 [Roridomyces roridus]|uniref:Uncharacterized protein n=1 Tax=Roridomyces roridus TaxID=1738132 RepID=A0AAD7FPF6_9AGAR|nr:hypothetical protein FB45DRAFT_747715 [Roridomyces roridus]